MVWLNLRAISSSGFPGQAGNLVGHANAPGFSSLTAFAAGTGAKTISDGTNATSGSGTVGDPWLFKYIDFNSLTAALTVAIGNTNYAQFIGCRFQSNSTTNDNVHTTSGNLTFSYCTVCPKVSLQPAPPVIAWPSASAGLGISYDSGTYSSYVIPYADGYQYGINIVGTGAPVTVDHCDIWGFGNAITFPTSGTQQINITNNWIHDCRNDNGAVDHTDCVGYLNGGAIPSNTLIQGNTLATISNTNMVAHQGGTGSPTNNKVIGNFISGGTNACQLDGVTTFTDNVFGTDLPWHNGPLHADYATQFNGLGATGWRRNVLRYLVGTTKYAGAWAWTSADDGKFILPASSGTLSVSDYTG